MKPAVQEVAVDEAAATAEAYLRFLDEYWELFPLPTVRELMVTVDIRL